jgi:hypothetical protein
VSKPDFVTLAEDLVGPAEAIERYFEDKGFKVTREPSALAYPYTPTLRCKRGRTTIVLEVDGAIRVERVQEWIRYGCSLSSDFRVAAVTPASVPRNLTIEDALRAEKAGIYLVAKNVTEICISHDLSLNMSLPELSALPPKVRAVLGPMYEQYEHSHWREAFESGCQAFEVACRAYLKAGLASGRIVVLTDTGKERKVTDSTLNKMSLGVLAIAFANIQSPNHSDIALASILAKINPNRILAAHHKNTAAAERKLRKYVGQDVWLFIAGLRKIFE